MLLKTLEKNMVLKRLFRKLFLHTTSYLEQELKDCRTILDLGCGCDSPLKGIHKYYSVGIDLSNLSLLRSKRQAIHLEHVLMDTRRLGFKPKSFDCVTALDILEHLKRVDGSQLMDDMEKIAKKKVVIQTPNGFVPQTDECPLQVHRSGWTVDDFKRRGYTTRGMAGLRYLRQEKARLRFKPEILWAIIAGLTQKIVYHIPKFAYQIFSVRILSEED